MSRVEWKRVPSITYSKINIDYLSRSNLNDPIAIAYYFSRSRKQKNLGIDSNSYSKGWVTVTGRIAWYSVHVGRRCHVNVYRIDIEP